ncbi:MAG: leucyl aminopeptidase family protein [Phycisphaeraceae bacterium]
MYRQIEIAESGAAAPGAVAVFVLEGADRLPAGYGEVDEASGGALGAAIGRSEFSGGAGSVTPVYPGRGPARVYLCGLGKADELTGEAVRKSAGALCRAAASGKVTRLAVRLLAGVAGRLSAAQAGAALADGLELANLEFDAFRGAAAGGGKQEPLSLSVEVEPELRGALERARVAAEAANTARRLGATPPNVANPAWVSGQCRSLAERVGLEMEVIDAARAKELGMGGLLAVGAGAAVEPSIVVLKWRGKALEGEPPVMLVGKAVTFDTGGYSLKPGKSMVGMKYDKLGGMAVIGAMEAAARLEVDVPVVGLVPLAENMVDERAYRPDDILTMSNGVTVEVTNTDAEGRLIMADALAWGTKEYRPRAVLDIATLTGGVVVALGTACAGVWCNDADLRRRIGAAADWTGERVWEMPLWREHRDLLKSAHADVVNSGEREAHPIQGAAFLSYFVGEGAAERLPALPWAHLDIAGTGNVKSDGPVFAKGPTGWGVRLIAKVLEGWGE